MIEAVSLVGFLVLIVLGLTYVMFRDRGGPVTNVQLENMARYVTAMYFSQQYEVKPNELLEMIHPQAMEEKAKRLRAENELAVLKKSTSGMEGTPP